MKNIWKWLLGIVLALVVLAGLVGAAFAVRNVMAAHMAIRQVRVVQGGTPNPQDGVSPKDGPMQHGFPGWHEPGPGFGFSPFHGRTPFRPGFMLLCGLMRPVSLLLVRLLVRAPFPLPNRAPMPLRPPAAHPA